MTIDELIDALDNYGGHVEVVVVMEGFFDGQDRELTYEIGEVEYSQDRVEIRVGGDV